MIKKVLSLFALSFSATVFAQEIVSDNAALTDAYTLAVNTVDINVRRGVLAAGGDYGGEWTRDIAINSWNAVSLMRPDVAANSLWSVTVNNKDTVGHQYWDKILWVIAAHNHYIATGDLAFLKEAYPCASNTMKELEQSAFDKKYGLFTGPSVFNDGIAAYPEPIFEKNNNSSSVLDHKNSKVIKTLSTNSVYYGAYLSLVEMAKILKADDADIQAYQQKAKKLKSNILKNFYAEKENKLYYLIDNLGKTDKSQEALGLSFAVIFNILNKEQALKITQTAVTSQYGITSIWPDFPRYSKEHVGRHNNIIWPMVNGFFAQASIAAGDQKTFLKEFNGLTQLALDADKGDYNFREIFNPNTGKPDGGWQANGDAHPDFHWESCRLQTWSATAYLNMVHNGLLGLRLENNAITFSPFLPNNIHYLEINKLKYQGAQLTVIVKGTGTNIKSFTVDGKIQTSYTLNANLKGEHKVEIELG